MTLKQIFFFVSLISGSIAALAEAPDVIFIHGRFLTGAHLVATTTDASQTPPMVAAVAARRGIITAVGTNEDVLRLMSAQTQIIDLHGNFAMPGFVDAHVHLWSAGAQKVLSVDLDGVRSLAEMQQRISNYILKSRRAPEAWIQGAGWDHTLWEGQELPSRADLDRVTLGHPAIFYRTDGHILVANSAALRAAGINRFSVDPRAGKIDRDARGNPTGILRELSALSLVERVVPQPSSNERHRALRAAIDDALSHGVTSVQDYSPDVANFLALERMERQQELHLRIDEWLDFDLSLPDLKKRVASHSGTDPLLRYTMLKGFMDGSLGSRTAALSLPYSDDAANSGIPRYTQSELDKKSIERARAGFQLGFHAIGDRANEMALNAFAVVDQALAAAQQPSRTPGRTAAAPSSRRFRMEHAQVVGPSDFDRFARLGVIASMQPAHLLTDMAWAQDRLGPQRSRFAYAWRSFLNHKVMLAFGTDYPVESVDPMRGLYAAVTRKDPSGVRTFEPQEAISLPEAIHAYTQGSAYAAFREHELGRLEPGFRADLIVLDRDLTREDPASILRTRVLRTVVNGQTVYLAK